MKTIACWSRSNKVAARLLIAVCHILIVCSACYAGIELSNIDLYLPPSIFWICLSLFLLTTLLISKSYFTFSFNKKKWLDVLILTCSFVMILSFSNQKNISRVTTYKLLNGSFAESSKKSKEVSEPSAKRYEKVSKPSMKELKKELKELKKMVRDEKASAAGVVLAILVGAVLSLLLAAASCSLACNNQGALALILLIGGLTGVFFLCRLIIKSTKKKNKEKDMEVSKPASSNSL